MKRKLTVLLAAVSLAVANLFGVTTLVGVCAANVVVQDEHRTAGPYVHAVPELPDYLVERAAFWADTGSISVIADGAGKLIQWRDVRETAAVGATPARIYGTPAWTNGDTTAFQGVNPSVVTLGEGETARKALYFNGRSGQYLRLKNGASNASIVNVRNVFAVHCPSNWFGAVVGAMSTSRRGVFQPYYFNNSFIFDMSKALNYALFCNRIDLGNLAYLSYSTRVAVDGKTIDPYSYLPEYKEWQTLELSSCGLYSGLAETIFFQNFENAKDARAGGDYLGEVLVFTNQLTRLEVEKVHAYLNAKWHFPIWRDEACFGGDESKRSVKVAPVEQIEIAKEAKLTMSVDADVVSRPFAFGGDGTLVKTGSGTLVVGASETGVPFAGELDLQEGDVYLRGGRALPVRGKSGMVVASDEAFSPTTADNCANGGIKLTRASGATGAFVKDGASSATVKGFDDDVKVVNVNGGELTIGGAARVGLREKFDIEVPNGDFEDEFRISKVNSDWKYNVEGFSGQLNGWTAISGGVSYMRIAKGLRFDAAHGGGLVEEDPDWKSWSAYIGSGSSPFFSSVYYPSGVGCQLLHLKQRAKVCNQIYFPRRGRYELLFDASSRYRYVDNSTTYGNLALRISVLFGDTMDGLAAVSYCRPGSGSWSQVRVPLGMIDAGNHYIGFETIAKRDNSAYIDNVRVRFVSEESTDVWPIPHGDFEDVSEAVETTEFAGRGYMSMENAIVGWNLMTSAPNQSCDNGINPPVAFVNDTTPMVPSKYNYPTDSQTTIYIGANTDSEIRHGRTCLCFVGNTSAAETSFTPPEGRWRLRTRVQRTYATYAGGSGTAYATYESADAVARLMASLRTDKGRVELGTVEHQRSAAGEAFPLRLFDVAFDADGQTEMTLTLSNATANVGCLVDDLVLVSEDSMAFAEDELVIDGSFEYAKLAGWTIYTTIP